MVPRMIVPPPPPPPPQPPRPTSSAAATDATAAIPRTRLIQHLSRVTCTYPARSLSNPPWVAPRLPSRRWFRSLLGGGAGNRPRQLLRRRERDCRRPRRAAQAREAVGELPVAGADSLAEPPGHHVGEEGPPEFPGIEPVPPSECDRPDLALGAVLATRWIVALPPKLDPAPPPPGPRLVDSHPEGALPQDRQHVLLSRWATTYEMPPVTEKLTQVEVNGRPLPAAAPAFRVEDLLGAGRRVPERAVHRSPPVAVQAAHE